MMQLSFGDVEFDSRPKTKQTCMERMTARLERLVPWDAALKLIRPYYHVAGRPGRQPYPLELMLRIHLFQITYNLSDPKMEDILLENVTARRFVGLSLDDRTPDETTILQFRHLLEEHDLGKKLLELFNNAITANGLLLSKGRIVDATFIEAPTSTKNKDKKRDPEMASGKKAETWHFGMKMHAATDDIIGIVAEAAYGPANEHDITRARELLPDDTSVVYGDAGYVGMKKREEFEDLPKAEYRIGIRPGKYRTLDKDSLIRQAEHFKSSVRSKVEHVFMRIKVHMGYRKTRYRGIAKNAHRLNTMLAVANLFTFECWCKRLGTNCAY